MQSLVLHFTPVVAVIQDNLVTSKGKERKIGPFLFNGDGPRHKLIIKDTTVVYPQLKGRHVVGPVMFVSSWIWVRAVDEEKRERVK